MLPLELTDKAAALLELYRGKKLKLATAESCTGGLIAGTLTEIAGSSAVVERGFVTYSNESKSELLGVPTGLISQHGAVSAEVAMAMAEGALAYSRADAVVAVTGVAGPGGGTAEKPVGLVFLTAQLRGDPPELERHQFHGDRSAVRQATVLRALELLEDIVG